MRFLFRIAVLALAAFGAKTLYDKYAPRAGDLQKPATDFADRAKSAVERSKGQFSSAAHQMTGAAKDMTDEIKSAADDAATQAAAVVTEDHTTVGNHQAGSNAATA